MAIRVTQRDLRRNAKLRAAIAATPEGRGYTKRKRDGIITLVGKAPHQKGVVDIAGPLLVRVTRRVGCNSEYYDHENLVGGAKRVQDAIAAFLSRKGDSEKDGLWWEYRQVQSEESEIVIEIFRKDDLR